MPIAKLHFIIHAQRQPCSHYYSVYKFESPAAWRNREVSNGSAKIPLPIFFRQCMTFDHISLLDVMSQLCEILPTKTKVGSYSRKGENQSSIRPIILALSCCLLLHLFLITYLIDSMWAKQFTLR